MQIYYRMNDKKDKAFRYHLKPHKQILKNVRALNVNIINIDILVSLC